MKNKFWILIELFNANFAFPTHQSPKVTVLLALLGMKMKRLFPFKLKLKLKQALLHFSRMTLHYTWVAYTIPGALQTHIAIGGIWATGGGGRQGNAKPH